MNIQDLLNIRPALLIAIETRGTMIQDKKTWIEIYEKIDTLIANYERSRHTATSAGDETYSSMSVG